MIEKIKKVMKNPNIKLLMVLIKRVDIPNASAAIAYYAMLAIFPMIIVAAALLPLFGITTDVALDYLQTALPRTIYQMVVPIVKSILSQSGVGALSLSLVVTLWSLSRVIVTVRNAQNQIFDYEPKNVAIIERLISLLWMVVVLGAMGALVVLASIGSMILSVLPIDQMFVQRLESAKLLIVFLGLFFGMGLFNWVLPGKKPRLIWALVGTAVEVVALLLLSKLFGYYVAIAGRTYSFYQAVGSVIILLIWLNLIATVIMLSTLVTAFLDEKWPGEGGIRTLWAKLREDSSE